MHAQAKLFNPGDKVIVQISPKFGKVYVHEMKAKQTVYSLAKAFDQKMQDIKSVNPNVNFDAMKVGQKIRVPFHAASMIKQTSQVNRGNDYAIVYYKIRPKDNLYRIAKIYFGSTVENLMEINRTQSIDLQADEIIKVGWMPIGSTPKASQTPTYDYTKVVNEKKSTSIAGNTDIVTTAAKPAVVQKATPQEDGKAIKTQKRRVSRQAKAKKGFLSRIFGSKKKKRREKKEIKQVITLSDQLEDESGQARKQSDIEDTQPINNSIKELESVRVEETPQVERARFEAKVEIPDDNLVTEEEVIEEPAYLYKSNKGIAIWNQSSSNSKSMFALHPTAVVGSYIEITNPMMNKTVNAKVIGNIPPRTYTDDVSIVVSPKVAKMLGVVDKRFAVRVKYREE